MTHQNHDLSYLKDEFYPQTVISVVLYMKIMAYLYYNH